MRSIIQAYLSRIEWDAQGAVVRLFPLTRRDGDRTMETAPKTIEINPDVCFGRPVIFGTRIPVEEIKGRFSAGESIRDMAEDFGLGPDKIEEAIRWNVIVAA